MELLIGKTTSSIFGVAMIGYLAGFAWWQFDAAWAPWWAAANFLLLVTQLYNYRCFAQAQKANQPLPVVRIILNGLIWATITGVGIAACAMTGHVLLAAFAGMTTAIVCAGSAARNSNVPRYAIAQICLCSLLYLAGTLLSPNLELKWMAIQTGIGAIALIFLVRQHCLRLVETVRLALQNRFLASHDALTGLANRFQLHELLALRLGNQIKRATDRAFTLLYIDLDRFKAVNDLHGHAVGDALLRAVADRLRAEMREIDTVARIGGDEFMVILNEDDLERIAATAQRLITTLSAPYDLPNLAHVRIGASIGSIVATSDAHSADILIAQADRGLYAAKRDGGGVHRNGADVSTTVDGTR